MIKYIILLVYCSTVLGQQAFSIFDPSMQAPTIVSSAPFSPSDLPNMSLWLRSDTGVYSDDGVTAATDGSTVYRWSDLSGNARHVYAQDSTKRPLYKVNQIGGKPSLIWDGVNDCLTNTFTDTLAKSVFLVISNSINKTFFLEHGTIFDDAQGDWYFYGSSVQSWNFKQSGGGSYYAYGTPNWAGTGRSYVSLIYSGSTAKYYKNSIEQSNGTLYGSPVSGSINRPFNIGSRNNGTSIVMGGSIAELIIYSGALSDTDRDKVHTYIQTRYGL